MIHPSFNAPALETMSRLLPAFEFTALIASNGLSAVYAANQRSLERVVAIRVISPHISKIPEFRESFEITARTMAKLNHPNLIGVVDSGFVDQMLYFVMEFIPGKSLEHSAQGHCVECLQALRLIEGICNGLSHAHDHGIVHGGIEPSIILLNQKAEPKIGNFGFNIPFAVDGVAAVAGKPTVAPEVAAGGTADQRSDIYAVGAILYQLLTGQPHRIDAPAPSTLSSCESALDVIWGKATHPDSVQRYAGIRTLLKEISALIKPQPAGVAKASAVPSPVSRVMPRLSPMADSSTTTSARPVTPHRKSFNWQIILNLFLLVVVGFVANYTWGKYKTRDAQGGNVIRVPATANAGADEKARAQAARLAAERDKRNLQNPDVSPDPVPPMPSAESPEDSLTRLREGLASGQRNEMPVGSVHKGENDYFLVEKPMSWPEAAWFAERHGAHLAVPSVGADLKWLVDNVIHKQAAWIGAARNGSRTWVLADGTPWIPSKEPSGTGIYVGVDKDGFMRAASVKIRLPFVIQWHRDGKNPGALDALLAITRQSLGKSEPIFPPGTRTFENRRFLVVNRPIHWSGAVDQAKQSGGNLAVPATVGEIAFLEEMTSDVDATDGIWIGGSLMGNQWTWITGEPWKTAKWAKDAASDVANAAVIIQPGKAWYSRNVTSLASGYAIEWSDDAKSIPNVSGNTPGAAKPSGANTEALFLKAKELIQSANLKRNEQLNANAKKFVADLDSHIRNLPTSGQQFWKSDGEKLKKSINNSRVPSMILRASDIKIDQVMDGIIKYCSKKQDQIDEEFVATVSKIHAAYLAKIRESIVQVRQAGQTLLAQSLDDALRQAEGMESWVGSMGIELRPENPKPGASEWKSNNEGDGHGNNDMGKDHPPPPPDNVGGGGSIE